MEITILCSNIFSSVKNEDGANSGEADFHKHARIHFITQLTTDYVS